MKLECIREKLSNAVFKSEKISAKNPNIPVLGCILLEAVDSVLKIKSTNLELGLNIEIPVKIKEEGSVAIPGNVLSSFLSNLENDKNVSLEMDEKNLLIISKGKTATVKSIDKEDFPSIPIIKGEKKFDVDTQTFIQGLKSVWYSASLSNIKPELSSIFIYSEEDGNIVFVATDSFRLAEKRVKIKGSFDNEGVLIPYKNIPEIIRVLEEIKGDVSICLDKNQISFSVNNIYLISRVVNGNFPDYKQIIPKEHTTEVVVLKQDFYSALKASTVFSDKFNQIKIIVDPDNKDFKIISKNNDIGEGVNSIQAVIEGEKLEINFNYKYIVDCFQSINTDSVSLYFNGVNKPLIIKGVSDKSFTYLVMPMNR